jgi:TetR/AcrR family transcriptional regulator, cholesterol catabolism regulator
MDDEQEDMRARIIRLSADMFAARGYHGTGVTELLEAIGVARGGFYHHFKSKQDVLLEIVSTTIDRILLSSAAIVDQDFDPPTKLRMLCDDLSFAIVENQAGFVIFLREYSALDHDAKERVLARRRSYLARWEEVLKEGTRTGSFAGRKTPFTEGILGMWIYSFVWNRASIQPETIAADLADFVLRGVRADAAPPASRAGRAARGARQGGGDTAASRPKRESGAA